MLKITHLEIVLPFSAPLQSLAHLNAIDWIGLALSVFFPIGLAVAGGILAAIAMPDETPRKGWAWTTAAESKGSARRKKWTWILSFVAAGVIAFVLGLGQQLLIVHQREADQREAKAKLIAAELGEQRTQTQLDLLVSIVQGLPGGVSEAVRGWIKSLSQSRMPIAPNNPKSSLFVASTPPISVLHEAALGLSEQVRVATANETKQFELRWHQRINDEIKQKVASGMTLQLATSSSIPVGGGSGMAWQDGLEVAKLTAKAKFEPQIQNLLSSVDSSNLSKQQEYSFAVQMAHAEYAVQTECLVRQVQMGDCASALQGLAQALPN